MTFFPRLLLPALSIITGLALCVPAAKAAPMLVVDAASGQVLYQNQAGLPWYPASLTKMMTAYVVLKRVKEGKFGLDSGLAVSLKAAKQAPSRMGFKPGTVVTVETALRIIMVKSANDVSYAIAENIGGSVEGFAALMNQDAARLGMTSSHFINPHGLPGKGQKTSARDMAVLARALLLEFPQQAYLWRLPAIRYGEYVMRNHNHLIGRYPGSDGMKTGFICSAGFNVVATASRDGQKLITVVMGAPSARERAEVAARLFERNFGRGGSLTLNELANQGGEAPDMRDEICRRKGKKAPVMAEDSTGFDVEVAARSGVDTSSPYAAMAASRGAGRAVTQMGEGTQVSLLQPYVAPAEPVDIFIGGERDMVRPVLSPGAVPVMAGAAPIPAATLQPTLQPTLAPGQLAVPGRPMALQPDAATATRSPGSLYPLQRRDSSTAVVAPTLTPAALAPAPIARAVSPAAVSTKKPDAKKKAEAKKHAEAKPKPKQASPKPAPRTGNDG